MKAVLAEQDAFNDLPAQRSPLLLLGEEPASIVQFVPHACLSCCDAGDSDGSTLFSCWFPGKWVVAAGSKPKLTAGHIT